MKQKEKRKSCPNCATNFSRRAFYYHKQKHHDGNVWTCGNRQAKIYPSNVPLQAASIEMESPSRKINDAADTEPICSSAEYPVTMTSSPRASGDVANDSTRKVTVEDFTSESDSTGTDSSNSSDTDSNSEDEQWEKDAIDPRDLFEVPEGSCSQQTRSGRFPVCEDRGDLREKCKALLIWVCHFLFLWQTNYLISDRALDKLLHFLSVLFKAISHQITALTEIAGVIPQSVYMIRRHLKFDRDSFIKYAVCPKCAKLYDFGELFYEVDGTSNPRKCSNSWIKSRGRQITCNSKLVKAVRFADGSKKYYPLKIYCYQSIIECLENMIKREGFLDDCQKWKGRNIPGESLADVYEGKLWKQFQAYHEQPLETGKYFFGFMINCDWFQPYVRRNVSVGVIYLTVLNLPRVMRFKQENTIVVGVIPPLDKEPASLNSFLEPVVKELNALWKGVQISTPCEVMTIQGALMCCSADLPANRKLCGFLSHSASLFCSKCLKKAPNVQTGETDKVGRPKMKNDYGGFERKTWPPRDNNSHRRCVAQVRRSASLAEREKIEKQLGVRYSCLLDLEYFDAVRYCAIDPMHNLFTGTAKKVFSHWVKKDILKRKALDEIDEKINHMLASSDLGRLPTKIASNYGNFTADEWKNWTLYFSMYALDGILPEVHLKCWQTFVLACRLICKPCISIAEVEKADFLFLKFCKEYETLHGSLAITPNMHLHTHLKECIIDFGPVPAFWCFAYERFNGLIADIPTNNSNIEVQFMRSVTRIPFVKNINHHLDFSKDFLDICNSVSLGHSTGTSAQIPEASAVGALFRTWRGPFVVQTFSDLTAVKPVGHGLIASFDSDDLNYLLQMYQSLYENTRLQRDHLQLTFNKYGVIHVGNEVFGSYFNKRSRNTSGIMAHWVDDDANIDCLAELRPGIVKYYIKHTIFLNSVPVPHVLAAVRWYVRDHAITDRYLAPITSWPKRSYLQGGASSFIPVQRIYGKFIAAHDKEGNVALSSLNRQLFL
ncbi:uncharacterized protein LOC110985747 [Acanthaster planci]|uniref:Uncharacterized protein LOC110985747 n=1 Tax=Acanthaster planci TaxID=133434 RepID=A0A8B7ZAK2_ACAPL|nr:uncharacterized protein LOC110985747 [Acanthaster planci]